MDSVDLSQLDQKAIQGIRRLQVFLFVALYYTPNNANILKVNVFPFYLCRTDSQLCVEPRREETTFSDLCVHHAASSVFGLYITLTVHSFSVLYLTLFQTFWFLGFVLFNFSLFYIVMGIFLLYFVSQLFSIFYCKYKTKW